MALITCPDCKSPVSSAAATCPSCGHPVAATIQRAQRAKRERATIYWLLGAIVVVIAIMTLGAQNQKPAEPVAATPTTPSQDTPDPPQTAPAATPAEPGTKKGPRYAECTSDCRPGIASVCLDDVSDEHVHEIELPAGAVFDDKGASDVDALNQDAAIVTMEKVTIRSAKCADVKVAMLASDTRHKTNAVAVEGHKYEIEDFIGYKAPQIPPAIEPGKLIDDIDLKAKLKSDVTAVVKDPHRFTVAADPEACHAGADALARGLGVTLGRQTSMVVFLEGLPADEASYGCPFGPHSEPDLNISFPSAHPSPAVLAAASKAGQILTGVDAREIAKKALKCVDAALKPSSAELATVEFRGIKVECQAFTRDGGGGSFNIYRRF